MIIYFTGTGNSRFVAERIAQATGDKVLDAAQYTRIRETAAFTEDSRYIFVAPTYISAPPAAFMEFIRGSIFPDDAKAYFIMTAAGSMSVSPAFCEQIAADREFTYMGTAEVIMPQNYIAYFRMGTPELNRGKIESARQRIEELSGIINAGQRFPETRLKRWEYISVKSVFKTYYRVFMSAKPFRVTEGCVGCGRCARICPLGNIEMKSGRPVWGKACTHCMGCINLCPEEAIEFGRLTRNKPRYHGPAE